MLLVLLLLLPARFNGGGAAFLTRPGAAEACSVAGGVGTDAGIEDAAGDGADAEATSEGRGPLTAL